MPDQPYVTLTGKSESWDRITDKMSEEKENSFTPSPVST